MVSETSSNPRTQEVKDPQRRIPWGNVIAIVAIIIPLVVFFFWQLERKELAYSIINSSSILTVSDLASDLGDLSILLNDEEIEGLVNYSVSIINTGNVPVLADDFEMPISFDLGSNGEVLQVSVSEASDDSLKEIIANGLVIENNPNLRIALPSILLNSGDRFTLNIITSQIEAAPLSLDARVVGVSRLMQFGETFPNNIISILEPQPLFNILATLTIILSIKNFIDAREFVAYGLLRVIKLLLMVFRPNIRPRR
jgi:hypothetical protein